MKELIKSALYYSMDKAMLRTILDGSVQRKYSNRIILSNGSYVPFRDVANGYEGNMGDAYRSIYNDVFPQLPLRKI